MCDAKRGGGLQPEGWTSMKDASSANEIGKGQVKHASVVQASERMQMIKRSGRSAYRAGTD